MIQGIKNKVLLVFKNNDKLSQKIYKNILFSFGVKGGSILIGLILVPMTISYISSVQYGIWITISSVVSWMSFFDIGLGNGLRNKLTNAVALKDYESAKIYISTTYVALTIISVFLFLCIYILNPFIDWRHFLNIPITLNENVQMLLLTVIGAFCLQFVLQIINTILTALHEPAMAGLIAFFGQLGLLITIFILKSFVSGSLQILVIALTFVPIFILIISSVILFKTRLIDVKPSFKHIDFKYIKEILNIGGAFFLIQIGALVLFQTNNIIIAKTLGPLSVTEFNVGYKLFSIVSMIFVIIVTPYWSGFTTAYAKNDFEWLRKSVLNIRKIWAILSVAVLLLYLISPLLFKYWVGSAIKIGNFFSIAMVVYIIVYMWQLIHVYFLNGLAKVRLQLILIIIGSCVNIPLSVFLAKRFGIAGVVSANTIIFLLMNIFFTIQVEKILKRNAKGLWIK